MKTAIVGTKFRGPAAIAELARLRAGDVVLLRREPQNEVDGNAVAVYRGAQHLGYVPRAHNRDLARILDDAPDGLVAEVTSEAIVHDGEIKFVPKILIIPAAEELKF